MSYFAVIIIKPFFLLLIKSAKEKYPLLACCRYIEMNAVRTGIVKRPEQYYFSSYRSKVGLERFDFLDEDPVYFGLGRTENVRQERYQSCFQESITENELKTIREAIQWNWPYGKEEFRERIENALGRKFEIKKAGWK